MNYSFILQPCTPSSNTTTIEPLSIHWGECNNDSSVDELLAFNLTCGIEVPEHVTNAISKMYRELKMNGTIINDLIGTEHAVIPKIYHYVRWVIQSRDGLNTQGPQIVWGWLL